MLGKHRKILSCLKILAIPKVHQKSALITGNDQNFEKSCECQA